MAQASRKATLKEDRWDALSEQILKSDDGVISGFLVWMFRYWEARQRVRSRIHVILMVYGTFTVVWFGPSNAAMVGHAWFVRLSAMFSNSVNPVVSSRVTS
jgi:hypothetical protein